MRDFPGEPPFDAVLPVRAKRKFHIRPEDALQIECVRWLRSQPHIRFMVCQPERLNPPVHRRDFLKALGILGNAGAPELIVLDGRADVWFGRALLCELKTTKGRLSPEQRNWRTFCGSGGFEHHIIRSVEDLQRALG